MSRGMVRLLKAPAQSATIHSGMSYPYYGVWLARGEKSFRGKLQAFFPDCPMLYIYGRNKPLMFHAQWWLKKLLARPGNHAVGMYTGHWVMMENPTVFHQTIAAWLSGALLVEEGVQQSLEG